MGLEPGFLSTKAGRWALALGFCMVASPAVTLGAEDWELAVRYGKHGTRYENAGAAIRFDPWWSRERGNWKATLRPELGFDHYQYSESGSAFTALNGVEGTGLFRTVYGSGQLRPYGELGLGIALLSNDMLGDKDLSSQVLFSVYIGLGIEFHDRWFAGWRCSHHSNANIKLPNDGLDLQQVVIGIRF